MKNPKEVCVNYNLLPNVHGVHFKKTNINLFTYFFLLCFLPSVNGLDSGQFETNHITLDDIGLISLPDNNHFPNNSKKELEFSS